jgi:hypothetical protein
LKALDQFFGWLMIALGVAHCVTSLRIQPLSLSLAAGLSGTAVAIVAAGFLNVVRARHGDGLTRAFSLTANVLVLVLVAGIAWPVRYHLLHDWQKLGIIIVTVVEVLFAFE